MKRQSRNFRAYKEFDNHEMIVAFTDDAVGLKGYIAIHNTDLGPALGGTRWKTYGSEEEALKDALNLSKAMSYKCALAGLPWGGGKAVIIASENLDRNKVLKSYAKYVEKLGGLFKTGTDVGVFDDDVKEMARYTSHMLGVSEGDRGDLSTSKMAALGVYYAIKASLADLFDTDSVKDRVIGIKGVGKLGGELARLLNEDGARLVIADIDQIRCEEVARQLNNVKVVDPKSIHKEKLDVFAPCALGGELRPKVIKELRTKIIAGGANNQLLDDRTGDELYKKGILFAPDYVSNAGGLIYVADELETDGFRKERVLQRVRDIQKTLDEIYSVSKKKKIAPHRIANEISINRIHKGSVSNGV